VITLVTPDQYKQAIYAHSQRSVVSSSFPGRNYAALADWLIRPNAGAPSQEADSWRQLEHGLIVVHNLDDRKLGRTRIFTSEETTEFTVPQPQQGKGHLVFVQGFLCPAWVAELGSRYRVDPEFFCRHLDFFDVSAHHSCFNTPSLLNTTNNIIQVHVSTILTDVGYSTTNLYDDSVSHRGLIREQMSKYKRSLQKAASCGDSIVRDYSILSDRYSVIEQRISICVAENGDGWVGLLCMDNGRDLNKSLVGPWNQDTGPQTKSNMRITSLPVIQHHPKMTWRKIGEVDTSLRSSINPNLSTQVDLPQSISTLAMEYPSLLSALDLSKRAQSDPLHALVPIFAHAAFSEVAFLNLVDELMDKLTEPLPLDNFQRETFESLQHFEIILERHAAHIRHSIRSIRILSERSPFVSSTNPPPGNPASAESKDFVAFQGYQQQLSSFSAIGTLQDHEDLLERCQRLLSRVHSAKTSEMNRAMILESRRAIEQSERTKKLTLAATYFIPLTFTASLFGMNFSVLGQGDLPVWWYIVVAVPFTVLTHLLYSWDVETLRLRYRRLLQTVKDR
ncbi:hypothetical protein P885DRAFT_28516, partial [Corynascus similis CBS 632.67]